MRQIHFFFSPFFFFFFFLLLIVFEKCLRKETIKESVEQILRSETLMVCKWCMVVGGA